jgi:hypothetical protein
MPRRSHKRSCRSKSHRSKSHSKSRSRRRSKSRSRSHSHSKGKGTTFYCVGCRKKVHCPAADICLGKDVRGRPRLVGDCKCGQTVYRYVKFNQASAMLKKYGKC